MIRTIYKQIKTYQLVVLAGLLFCGIIVFAHPQVAHASTTCPTDTSRGEVTGTFFVPYQTTSPYIAYTRMMASSSTDNTLILEVDGTCYNIGGSSVPIYSGTADWTNDSADWIDTESGSSTPVSISLSPGNHTYELIGNADNVRVDRVLFVLANGGQPSCVPSGTGNNCASLINQTNNLVSGKTFYSSDGASSGSPITNINDGNETTRWISNVPGAANTPGNNPYVCVDLGSDYTLNDVGIDWAGNTVDQYQIQMSTATPTGNCTTIATGSWFTVSTGTTDNLTPDYIDTPSFSQTPSGRYLRIVFNTMQNPANNFGESIWEVGAYGTPYTPPPTCTTGESVNSPTGLSQVPDSNGSTEYTQIKLSWTAGSLGNAACSVSGYNVYRNGSLIGTINGDGSTPATTFIDNNGGAGFTAGTSNSYTVSEFDSASPTDTSAQSSPITGSTHVDNEAPTVPQSPSASASNSSESITLKWTPSTDLPNPGGVGVASYNIYRTTTLSGGQPVFGAAYTSVSGANASSFTDNGLAATTTYYYEVTAVDKVGNESAPSTVVNAITMTPPPTCTGNPSAPGKPTLTSNTVSSITLTWTASTPSSGCTLGGYKIFRADVSPTSPIGTSSTNSYSDSANLAPNTAYTYTIEAYDNSGHTTTGASGQLSTLADTTPPIAPASLTASVISSTQINLSWPAGSPGSEGVAVASYNIYRNGTILTNVPATQLSYQDTSVSPSTTYTYQIASVDKSGLVSTNKTSSQQVTTPAGTGSGKPTQPDPTITTLTNSSVAISWNPSSETGGTIVGYHAYINTILDTYNNNEGSIAAVVGQTPSYTASCLAPNANYSITVTAYDSSGNTTTSSPLKFTTLPANANHALGDVDCQGSVNATDLFTLLRQWGSTTALPTDGDSGAPGDTTVNNPNHIVESTDLFNLLRNWGQ